MGGTCLSEIELFTSQVFSVCVFQFGKLIPFLLLPVHSWLLCADGRKEEMELSITCGPGLGLDSDGHWVIVREPDYSNGLFYDSVHLSPVSFYYVNH